MFRVLGGLLVVMVGFLLWFRLSYLPMYHEGMFAPRPFHVKTAHDDLKELLGPDAEKIAVPAVNKDINLIYVTAPLSPGTRDRIKKEGKALPDLGPDCYVASSGGIDFYIATGKTPARILFCFAGGNSYAKEFFRVWIEKDAIPWDGPALHL